MYYTGIDPFTKNEVHIAKGMRDRKTQRALMQFFKTENWFTVREALVDAGRADLIGNGCDCLIPARPPKEAIEARGGGPMMRIITTPSPTRPRGRSRVSAARVPGNRRDT